MIDPAVLRALEAAGATTDMLIRAIEASQAADEARRVARREAGGWAGLREAAFARDGYRCTYCGSEGDGLALHCDHIIPRCEGGSDVLDNLTTACRRCNLSKGGRVAPKERT